MRRTDEKTNKGTSPELRRLISRASALLAAVVIMLGLLVSSALPDKASETVRAISGPVSVFPSVTALPSAGPQAGPQQTAPVTIRLADADGDVGPEVIIRLINTERVEPMTLSDGEPRILIYHTHDSEAYRQAEGSRYEDTGGFRTEDNDFNVYAVGEELKRILGEQYGIDETFPKSIFCWNAWGNIKEAGHTSVHLRNFQQAFGWDIQKIAEGKHCRLAQIIFDAFEKSRKD